MKRSFNLTFQYWRLVCSEFLVALGVLLSLWKLIEIWQHELSKKYGLCIFIIIVVMCVFWAFIRLFRTRKTLEIEINQRTKLTIEKADMFAAPEKAACVIPVNEYFDTHLGDGIIADNTLHGKLLKIFEGRISELRSQIEKQLTDKDNLQGGRKRTAVDGLPETRYPLGTCVRVHDTNRDYILVAICRFNKDEHPDVSTEEYPEIIRKMYNGIENLRDAKAVYMPLVGSGNSGYELTNMQMLNTMVQAACNSDKLRVTDGMHICIYKDEDWNSLNLNVIEYLFDRWKSLK